MGRKPQSWHSIGFLSSVCSELEMYRDYNGSYLVCDFFLLIECAVFAEVDHYETLQPNREFYSDTVECAGIT